MSGIPPDETKLWNKYVGAFLKKNSCQLNYILYPRAVTSSTTICETTHTPSTTNEQPYLFHLIILKFIHISTAAKKNRDQVASLLRHTLAPSSRETHSLKSTHNDLHREPQPMKPKPSRSVECGGALRTVLNQVNSATPTKNRQVVDFTQFAVDRVCYLLYRFTQHTTSSQLN